MALLIRAAEPSDYEAICDTMAQPIAQAQTLQLPLPAAELWKKRLADFPPDGKLIVAELDGKVVGNLGLHPAHKSPRMRHVYGLGITVHDAYQRRGVGAALMEKGIDLAENWMAATRIELTVYVDNAAAIALYRRFGFEIEGTLRRYALRNGEYVDAHMMSRIKA